MGRFRHVVVALTVFGLIVPVGDADAQVRDTESDCRPPETYVVHGDDDDLIDVDIDDDDDDLIDVDLDDDDDDDKVATYTLTASWCLERVFETTTVEGDSSVQSDRSDGTVTATSTSQSATLSAADADDAKQLKRKKGKKGKKGKRARRARRRGKGGSESAPSRTRSERRLVSTCITNFQLTTTAGGEADLLDATQTPVPDGDSCSGRTYRVQGRFGHDYIEGVPGFTRNVITQTVSGTKIENYPLGRVGYFDVTVRFNRDRGATCSGSGCLPTDPFKFCDLRMVTGDAVSCIRL